MSRNCRSELLLAACVLLLPTVAAAQTGTLSGVVVAVADENGNPLSNVPIFQAVNGGKSQIAMTSSDGSTRELKPTGVTGETVRVVVQECNNQRQIVLQLDNTRLDDCEELTTAVIPVDKKSHVSVRLTPGGATIRTTSAPPAPGLATTGLGTGTRLQLELGAGYSSFGQFREVVGARPGVSSLTTEESYVTPIVGLRLVFARRFCIGSRLTRGKLHYRQVFEPNGPATPTFIEGDLTGTFVENYLAFRTPFGPVVIDLTGGAAYAHNALDAQVGLASGSQAATRSESGWKFNAGAALEYALTPNYSLRASYSRITSFEDIDADEQNSVGLSLVLPAPFLN